MPDATILHADLDAFYASVEQRDQPRLRNRPVIVGGGVVLAASYEARASGVRSGMGGREARALCPTAVMVAPRMSAYSEASRAVFGIFEETSPLVEGISIDEAFLDVSGLRRLVGPPVEIAATLRARVRSEVGLPITVGVASTKFLAKVASGVGKPDGLLIVPPGTELTFLHGLPVRRLWGVGPKTEERLAAKGVHSVAEVAALPEEVLVALLGPGSGRHLHALAHNRDPRVVRTHRRRRSIGAQRALGRGPHSAADLDAVLVELVDRTSRRLRDGDRAARTVVIRLRFGDFTTATRSGTLSEPTDDSHALLTAARRIYRGVHDRVAADGITLLGVSLANLGDGTALQLVLPFEKRANGALDRALDEVRNRFGGRAVTRAVLLDRPPDLEVPLLPDPVEPSPH